MKKIQNPHDKYVKFNLSVKDNIIELCKNCIPEKLFHIIVSWTGKMEFGKTAH